MLYTRKPFRPHAADLTLPCASSMGCIPAALLFEVPGTEWNTSKPGNGTYYNFPGGSLQFLDPTAQMCFNAVLICVRSDPLPDSTVKLLQLMTRPVVWLLLGCIKCYQFLISPMLPSTCRFSPTCSEYAYRAIRTHGVVYGLALGIRRLFRCHPWGGSGFDPVPPGEHRPNVVPVSESDQVE